MKIIDLGISKEYNEECNTIVGSFYYKPLEVIEEDRYDYKFDIYSLGIIFFNLLTDFLHPYIETRNRKLDQFTI